MKSRINSCNIAALLWSVITLSYSLSAYFGADGPVPLHWDLEGRADRWGSPGEMLALPVGLFLLTAVGVAVSLFVQQEHYRDVFVRDAITFALLAFNGYLGALCVTSDNMPYAPGGHVWTHPGNVFCMAVSLSILYFAHGASKSRRIILPGTNGTGTCLIDLRSDRIRKVWCASLALTGIAGAAASLLSLRMRRFLSSWEAYPASASC
ncbi:DUF1648 domain-containing protein [Bifidobacterium tsurumiense]|uniref:DUF1648 domain-containing protein n=1 Tax=Bifidobacterium tsurumiense TaxID=356829 RepID=UPI0018A6CFB9|nr:DUF1648 domain-containing protein [Bifidobacterium tsurumiense]MDY4678392.1 DUF1648 domain-containing protein [Bifidobacterium tsurumiense]